MDWIRRNWPDLLIGFALLAVISGIVATLLTGGSFFPLGTGNTPAPRTEAQIEQPSLQNVPDETAEAPGGTAGEPGTTAEPDRTDVSALPLLPQTAAPDGTSGPAGQTETLPDGPVNPLAAPDADPVGGVVAVRPGDAGQPSSPPSPATPPASQPPATPTPATPATPAATPAPSSTVSGEGPTAQVPYTVSVGAFRNAENAERQASVFRQAGYSVLVAEQDDINVVLLGPYAAESEAARVRDAVATGGFDVQPIVYTYQDDDEPTAVQPASTTPAAPAQSEPASEPPATPPAQPAAQPASPPAASASGRFLQVGAYSSQENATLQEQTLAGLGYAVTRQQDGNLIRVLVGPYADAELTTARNRLAAQGIEAIPR